MKFVKEVPPTNITPKHTQTDDEVTQLKQRPREWALVRSEVTAGVGMAYKKRGCEVQTRTSPGFERAKGNDRRFDIYARWNA